MQFSKYIFNKLKSLRHIFMREGWRSCTSMDGKKWVRVKLPRGEWQSSFCADPFLFRYDGGNWLFFETMTPDGKGIIGCSKESQGKWVWQGVALEEPWHLSYPQVFEEAGKIYMIPESCKCGAVCLYEAEEFPLKWKIVKRLIEKPFADSTLLKHDNHFYLACYSTESGNAAELWHSPNLLGPWERHPMCFNINQSRRLRRCGGAFSISGGRIFRVAQDCNGFYGKRLFGVEVKEISPLVYYEGEFSLLADQTMHPRGFKHTYNELEYGGHKLKVIDRHCDVLRPIGEILGRLYSTICRKLK